MWMADIDPKDLLMSVSEREPWNLHKQHIVSATESRPGTDYITG